MGEVGTHRLGQRIAVAHQTFFSTPIDLWTSAQIGGIDPVDPALQKPMQYDTSVALTKHVLLEVRFSDYDLDPTGRLVPLAIRQALVDAAHVTGAWLVEDDP